METQWYLCEIVDYPNEEGENLKIAENLLVRNSGKLFDEDEDEDKDEDEIISYGDLRKQNTKVWLEWFVWLPIIPRVGDTLQLGSWKVKVSKVLLLTDCTSKTGTKKGVFISARISIRRSVVPDCLDHEFSIAVDNGNKWENYARRGHDLEYFAWALKHEIFLRKDEGTKREYYHYWHTRVRPVTGDIITVNQRKWKVTSVELANANQSIDGWLNLEPVS